MKKLLFVFLLFPFLILAQTNFEKGEKLFKEGKLDLALPVFELFLKTNPSDVKTIEYLGDIAVHSKSWDKAIGYYERLKLLRPKDANYCYKYGGALGMKAKESNKIKALSMITEVRSSFEKAIKLNSKHIEARWALIELNLQLPGIVGGSEEKALQYSEELREFSPVDGHLSKGHIDEYFKRYKEAELQYKRAIIVGGSRTCYQVLASLYKSKMNEPEKARLILEEYKKKTNR